MLPYQTLERKVRLPCGELNAQPWRLALRGCVELIAIPYRVNRHATRSLARHRSRLAAPVMAALPERRLDFTQAPLADDFCHDTNADLFGRIRANVQANRRMNAV